MTDLCEADAKRVLIVAHPDDECLWFAGLLMQHPGNWRVYCCSIPKRDPIRAFKFYEACRRLGAIGEVLPFEEQPVGQDLQNLWALPDVRGAGIIVTHGPSGEYGHNQHCQLHRYIVGRYGVDHRILCSAMRPRGLQQGPLRIKLDDARQLRKRFALAAYDHEYQRGGLMMPAGAALIDEYLERMDIWEESYAHP